MRRRKLSPLEGQVFSQMIKAGIGPGHKATAAKLRAVRAELRTYTPKRADEPRLYAVATVLAELARLQRDRENAARILESSDRNSAARPKRNERFRVCRIFLVKRQR